MEDFPLLNDTMHDGSRKFLFFPREHDAIALWLSIFRLSHAYPALFLPAIGETWFDFYHKGRSFTVHEVFDAYWFFANDPRTDEAQLEELRQHFLQFA